MYLKETNQATKPTTLQFQNENCRQFPKLKRLKELNQSYSRQHTFRTQFT